MFDVVDLSSFVPGALRRHPSLSGVRATGKIKLVGRDKLSAAVTERKPSRAQGEFICPAAEIEEGASGRNILGAISHVTSKKERGVVRRRFSPLESLGRWKPTGCDKQAAASGGGGGGGAAKSMVATADEKTKRSSV